MLCFVKNCVLVLQLNSIYFMKQFIIFFAATLLLTSCGGEEAVPPQQNIVSTVIPGESESYDQGHATPTPAVTDFDKNLRAFDGTEN